jgi:chromosome segregation ATPase
VTKKAQQEIKSLYDRATNPIERGNVVYERLNKEILECYKMEEELDTLQRKLESASKEKYQIASELAHEKQLRSKLEDVCRDLQKQNKQILDDSKSQADQEKKQRMEYVNEVQKELDELSQKMQLTNRERAKQFHENKM